MPVSYCVALPLAPRYRLRMQSQSVVFAFEDPVDFLNFQLKERQKKNPKFSLRAWARQIGFENPSLLFQVLRKERKLKLELATKLASNLNLKGKSLKYFEIIVLKNASSSETEKRVYEAMIARVRPKKYLSSSSFSLELFSMASEWYHWAILEMSELRNFVATEEYIQARLIGAPDKKTIRLAIDRLVRLGFFTKDSEGKIVRANTESAPNFLRNKIPSEAVRSYHKQMIEKAKAAVEEQSVEDRYLRGTTIPFKRSDREKVEEIIRNAHKELLELAAKGDAEELYQLNTQFFRLTKKSGEYIQ